MEVKEIKQHVDENVMLQYIIDFHIFENVSKRDSLLLGFILSELFYFCLEPNYLRALLTGIFYQRIIPSGKQNLILSRKTV